MTLRGTRTRLQAQLHCWERYFERQKVTGKSSGGCRFPNSITWCSVCSATLEGREAAKCPLPSSLCPHPAQEAGPVPSLGTHHPCDQHQTTFCIKLHLFQSECQVLFLSFPLLPCFLNVTFKLVCAPSCHTCDRRPTMQLPPYPTVLQM